MMLIDEIVGCIICFMNKLINLFLMEVEGYLLSSKNQQKIDFINGKMWFMKIEVTHGINFGYIYFFHNDFKGGA